MNNVATLTSSALAGFGTSTGDDPVLHGGLTRSRARSLVECAVLSYKSEAEVRRALEPDLQGGGCLRFQWFEAVGRATDSQAFACVVPGHVILAFRGTKELRDFLTDALCVLCPLKDFHGQKSSDGDSVHFGFQRALDALWSDKRTSRIEAIHKEGPALDAFLAKIADDYPESHLWLTGHSLGAALATIAAARVKLTVGAPFKDRIGALVTVGSPRVLNNRGAEKLKQALGPDRILRIHRSIDPVPAVPYWKFQHVSGPKAYVSNQGKLVMGLHKKRRWAERTAAFLLALEDSIGSMLPGQHRGLGKFVSDHSSEGYLHAVNDYSLDNKVRVRDTLAPIAVPLMKLILFGTVAAAAAKTLLAPLL